MSQYTNYYNQLCDDINEEYERRKRQESKAATKLYENTEHQISNGGVKGQKEVKLLFSCWTVILDYLDIFVFGGNHHILGTLTIVTLLWRFKRPRLPYLIIHFLKRFALCCLFPRPSYFTDSFYLTVSLQC